MNPLISFSNSNPSAVVVPNVAANWKGASAGASVGSVGTYAMLEPTSSLAASSTGQPGTTHAGSSLKYSDTNGTDGSSPGGTWRLMGNVNSLHRSVYLRIS